MSRMESAIRAEGLRKRFGARIVLADVGVTVERGEIVGLLGPNGAGKSTTLAILATQLDPDEGTVSIAGHRLPGESLAARRALGLVPQETALYPTLSATENLRFFARMLGLRKPECETAVARVLDLVALADRAEEPVEHFSGGMRRRLNLACGILHAPEVLLLDEPSTGIDGPSRERIHVAVERLAEAGAAVLISTHDMDEAERLCDRILLLDGGRLVAAGTPAELVTATGIASSLSLRMLHSPPADWLDGLGSVRVLAANGASASLALDDPAALPVLLARAARLGGDVVEMRFERPTLADAFYALTGHALRDGDGVRPSGTP
jgi:ABC-2 type transport system ATP-binding protein